MADNTTNVTINTNTTINTSTSTTATSSSADSLPRHLLSLLHPLCSNHLGLNLSQTASSNVSRFATATPLPNLSSEDVGGVDVGAARSGQGEKAVVEKEEDTDFGAVMYITAVLVFYSLGIVVMIIKYLKTERKEMEEEAALENFFKGIPSKKIEHEQEAVNRVAIRAFHTLTSGVARAGSGDPSSGTMMRGGGGGGGEGGGRSDEGEGRERGSGGGGKKNEEPGRDLLLTKSDFTSDPGDSDSSTGEPPPDISLRERSKHLPRVSLMFRDSRSHDRRKMQDSIRSKRERNRVLSRNMESRQLSETHVDSGRTMPARVHHDRNRTRFSDTSLHKEARAASPAQGTTEDTEAGGVPMTAVRFEGNTKRGGCYNRSTARHERAPDSSRCSCGETQSKERPVDRLFGEQKHVQSVVQPATELSEKRSAFRGLKVLPGKSASISPALSDDCGDERFALIADRDPRSPKRSPRWLLVSDV